ncbi:hypothetical protein ASJ81_07905 [Methanosarcina spelaei]|uniref:Uncharacterized protein n=1 Tax=Methanosarcina spelaei TaxID=1036679 RepID=A0A2A2HRD4_9EURY|nr:tetratricopeptide repeat protein [Methanosarcina spelaei]PAV12059.1 hypothetical protein ASJ81_07905 [Methanosarcina spelaei]
MSVCPANFDEKVKCPFVDRKEFIEAFENAFWNIDQKNYSILVYYGVAGIGKTSLRKELPTLIEKHNESDWHTRVIWTSIDFATEQYRQPYKFLEVLSSQLRQKYGIKFNSFDIALATYWKKINPYSPLVKEDYSENSIVRDVLDICDEFVPVNLIPNVYKLAKSLPERYQKWALKRKEDISKLPNLEPTEIYERLPVYLAHDLADHLQNTSESAVIFIDTYEALWEKDRDKGSFNSRDEWLRKLIENIQKSCLWVICGKESLRWEEVDEDWKNYLYQRKIGKLPEKDALDLLKQCGITEENIQKVLIESSEGVPYYLELSIDIYRKIKQKKQPTPENFAKVPEGIFCRFVKYLDGEEKETLKVLSVPRYWNRELFKKLVKEFNTGYPATSFSELHSFSFMDIDDKGKCSMHQLMRKSLQDNQDQDLKKEVHNFMLDFYSNQLKDLDIKAITQEHENALIEAFYHAKESLEAEELCEWFISVSDPFDRAAFWQLITSMYEEMLQILEAKLGPENPSVATALNNLAGLYKRMGEYEKALQLYQRTLDIREKTLGSQHPDFATTLNNFAELYRQMGEYEKALSLYQKALEIDEKVLGPYHPSVATTIDNLALLYRQMGEYEKALQLSQRALEICEKVFNPQHPDVAIVLNNLSLLYYQMGDYDRALPLYQKALNIQEEVFGPQHPDVATTLNNLAGLYNSMGEYEKALPLYQRTLDIQENVLGLQHPTVAATLNNLAELYHQMGDYEKALPLHQRALNIREKMLDPQHPDIAITLNNIALLYNNMGEYEKALPLYQRALKILEDSLGLEHPDVAVTLNNLAIFYSNIGKYEEALPLFERAVDIIDCTKLGLNHPYFSITINNLIGLYDSMLEEMIFYGYLRS